LSRSSEKEVVLSGKKKGEDIRELKPVLGGKMSLSSENHWGRLTEIKKRKGYNVM